MEKARFKEHVADVMRTLTNKDVSLNSWTIEFIRALKKHQKSEENKPGGFSINSYGEEPRSFRM